MSLKTVRAYRVPGSLDARVSHHKSVTRAYLKSSRYPSTAVFTNKPYGANAWYCAGAVLFMKGISSMQKNSIAVFPAPSPAHLLNFSGFLPKLYLDSFACDIFADVKSDVTDKYLLLGFLFFAALNREPAAKKTQGFPQPFPFIPLQPMEGRTRGDIPQLAARKFFLEKRTPQPHIIRESLNDATRSSNLKRCLSGLDEPELKGPKIISP